MNAPHLLCSQHSKVGWINISIYPLGTLSTCFFFVLQHLKSKKGIWVDILLVFLQIFVELILLLTLVTFVIIPHMCIAISFVGVESVTRLIDTFQLGEISMS